MNYLSFQELTEKLNRPGNIYKNLTYKITKDEIKIPYQNTNKTLNTYTFKIAPNTLSSANELILNSIQDRTLLLAYSFDVILNNKDTSEYYLFTGHNYFSLYNPNADNLLTEVTRLELQNYINNINFDSSNILFVNNIKSDLSIYRILCANIFVVSASNLISLLT